MTSIAIPLCIGILSISMQRLRFMKGRDDQATNFVEVEVRSLFVRLLLCTCDNYSLTLNLTFSSGYIHDTSKQNIPYVTELTTEGTNKI